MMPANENSPPVDAAAASTPRSRLPRWTRHETLVLIQARRGMERRGLQQKPVRPRANKWAAVSAYCRRHGVERGPMQCRKRWGNLSWDLKKIVAWEGKKASGGPQHESFWDMRGEERRARQLPSSFDREVYDAIVGGTAAAGEDDVAAVLPDSGGEMDGAAYEQPPIMATPISARRHEPPPASSEHGCSNPATESEKKGGAAASSDKNSTSQQDAGGGGFKDDSDATFDVAGAADEGTPAAAAAATTVSIGKQVIEALERGNQALMKHLEVQKSSWDADREQRAAILAALARLGDAVTRIADKL